MSVARPATSAKETEAAYTHPSTLGSAFVHHRSLCKAACAPSNTGFSLIFIATLAHDSQRKPATYIYRISGTNKMRSHACMFS